MNRRDFFRSLSSTACLAFMPNTVARLFEEPQVFKCTERPSPMLYSDAWVNELIRQIEEFKRANPGKPVSIRPAQVWVPV